MFIWAAKLLKILSLVFLKIMELEKKLHSKVKEDYSSYSIGFKQQQKPNNVDAFFQETRLKFFCLSSKCILSQQCSDICTGNQITKSEFTWHINKTVLNSKISEYS